MRTASSVSRSKACSSPNGACFAPSRMAWADTPPARTPARWPSRWPAMRSTTPAAAADPMETLRLAVAEANAAVYDAGAGKTGRDHMGTTLTAAVLFNHRVVVGHVATVAATSCETTQITPAQQGSLVGRRGGRGRADDAPSKRGSTHGATSSPARSACAGRRGRCLPGAAGAWQHRRDLLGWAARAGLRGGDLRVRQSARPNDAVDALVQLANDRGGPDNISVVVARVLGHEADEADTERGFPVLSEAYVPTSTGRPFRSRRSSQHGDGTRHSDTDLSQPPGRPALAAPIPPPVVPPVAPAPMASLPISAASEPSAQDFEEPPHHPTTRRSGAGPRLDASPGPPPTDRHNGEAVGVAASRCSRSWSC